jgi:hypothetical protein
MWVLNSCCQVLSVTQCRLSVCVRNINCIRAIGFENLSLERTLRVKRNHCQILYAVGEDPTVRSAIQQRGFVLVTKTMAGIRKRSRPAVSVSVYVCLCLCVVTLGKATVETPDGRHRWQERVHTWTFCRNADGAAVGFPTCFWGCTAMNIAAPVICFYRCCNGSSIVDLFVSFSRKLHVRRLTARSSPASVLEVLEVEVERESTLLHLQYVPGGF